jgi:hypothetical protein
MSPTEINEIAEPTVKEEPLAVEECFTNGLLTAKNWGHKGKSSTVAKKPATSMKSTTSTKKPAVEVSIGVKIRNKITQIRYSH